MDELQSSPVQGVLQSELLTFYCCHRCGRIISPRKQNSHYVMNHTEQICKCGSLTFGIKNNPTLWEELVRLICHPSLIRHTYLCPKFWRISNGN